MNLHFRSTALLALVLASIAPTALAVSAEFPDRRTIEDVELRLVGTGTFRWAFFSVYDGALYLSDPDRVKAVPGDFPMRLELAYRRDIDREKFVEGAQVFLRKNASEDEIAAIQDRVEKINQAYRSVESGDRYALTYIPGSGTELALNGETLARVQGDDFARIYLRIWLGNEPISDSFRRDLLGLSD